jgi:pimeloyl-ACP methyl ester carboxylesterase
LAGKHDSLRPLDHVRAVAATLPSATVKVMDTAHLMSQQAPEELARHIKRFHDDAILGWRYAQPN